MWWKQVREFPINICHNLNYNLTIWILYFNFTATCVLIPCGWCDSLMSSLFRDQSIITVWPSAISCRTPPAPQNKEYQAFVYPAAPQLPPATHYCSPDVRFWQNWQDWLLLRFLWGDQPDQWWQTRLNIVRHICHS